MGGGTYRQYFVTLPASPGQSKLRPLKHGNPFVCSTKQNIISKAIWLNKLAMQLLKYVKLVQPPTGLTQLFIQWLGYFSRKKSDTPPFYYDYPPPPIWGKLIANFFM